MRVGVNFALIDQALFVIVEKLDRVFDGNHVLFTLGVDPVEHGGKRGGLARTGRTSDQHQTARLVAHGFDDLRQTQGVESLNLPGNGTEDRADGATLIEDVASEACQILQAERKVQFQIFLEAMLLRVGEHTVGQRLGIRGGQRRHIQRTQSSVHAHARRAVGGDVQVAAAHLDHLFQQFAKRDPGHCSPSLYRTVSRSTSSMVV